jgi:2-C-methyl-D-erythritol 4-phosphate cytidylyltransferase
MGSPPCRARNYPALSTVNRASTPKPERVSVLILAAGSGDRIGRRPKAFLRLDGQTLLERAVALVSPFATEIIVGVRPEDLPRARRLVPKAVQVVAGGATRQETLSRLLRCCTKPIVLLHEVARPFATAKLFERLLQEVRHHGAVVLYMEVPARDSLGFLEKQGLKMILPRRSVVALQVPHAYQREVLLRADRLATRNGWNEEGTAAVVKRAGHKVRLIPGSPDNLKVTYVGDLKFRPHHQR